MMGEELDSFGSSLFCVGGVLLVTNFFISLIFRSPIGLIGALFSQKLDFQVTNRAH